MTAIRCSVCSGGIFVADTEPDGTEIWSHLDGPERCDDPTPSIPCRSCGTDYYPLHTNSICALCWVPLTDEDWSTLPVLSLVDWAAGLGTSDRVTQDRMKLLDNTDRKD